MEANEYQRRAALTAGQASDEDRHMYTALGIAGEAGEVADLVKKWKFHAHPYDQYAFLSELGDVQWYLAMAATAHGFTLAEVMEFNLDKLAKRYPGGFSSEKSINRET